MSKTFFVIALGLIGAELWSYAYLFDHLETWKAITAIIGVNAVIMLIALGKLLLDS